MLSVCVCTLYMEVCLICVVCTHCRNTSDPMLVEGLRDKNVVRVAAGGSHSAAVTESGQLYTWGKGSYGRLGHG